jgi:hypothetical protein
VIFGKALFSNKSFFVFDGSQNLIYLFDKTGNFVAKSYVLDGADAQSQDTTKIAKALWTWQQQVENLGFKWDPKMQKYLDKSNKNRTYSDDLIYNTIDKNDMTGDEADGWDYAKTLSPQIKKALEYNYDFYIEIEGLGPETIKLPYKARWVPKFKAKKHESISGTKEYDDGAGNIITENTYKMTYEAYLSGGKLDIVGDVKIDDVNYVNKSSDEVAAQIEENAEIKKQIEKDKAKAKKDKEKEDKATKKANKDKQKALVKDKKGTLI